MKVVRWAVQTNASQEGRHHVCPLRNILLSGRPSHSVFIISTHEHIAHVLAAVLVYLYIFLGF